MADPTSSECQRRPYPEVGCNYNADFAWLWFESNAWDLRGLEGRVKQWKISIINDSTYYQRYFSATLSLSIQLLSQRLQLFLCFFTMLLNYAPYCFHDRWSKEQRASFASKMFNFASIQRSTMDLHTMHLHTMICDASLDAVFLNSTSQQWSAFDITQRKSKSAT